MTHRFKSIFLILGDIFILYLSLFLTVWIYRNFQVNLPFFYRHLLPFSIIFPVWLVIYFIEGMYSLRTFKQTGMLVSLVRSMVFNSLISFVFFYLFSFSDISPRMNVFILATIATILIFGYRKLFFAIFSFKGLKIQTMAIGDKESVIEIKAALEDKPYLGFEINKQIDQFDGNIPTGTQLIAVDRKIFSDRESLRQIINLLDQDYSIVDLTQFSELVTGKIPVSALDESWFIQNCGNQFNRSYWFSKNLLDRSVALIIFICVFPIYLLLIPFLLLVSGRPIFYSQIRTGLKNKPFRIYKLRTMTVNAEKEGAKWATPQDARVTPIGKFLRKTRLDEIPQLWNILNGDMSLVGPRPERPEIIESKLASTIPFYNFRHLVKPGVTGWAQVNYRYGYSEEDSLVKLTYDLYYVKNKSIWLDIKIILKTIKTVMTGMGH